MLEISFHDLWCFWKLGWPHDEPFSFPGVNYLRFVSGSKINIEREFRLLWVIMFHCINVSGVAEDNMLLLRSSSC